MLSGHNSLIYFLYFQLIREIYFVVPLLNSIHSLGTGTVPSPQPAKVHQSTTAVGKQYLKPLLTSK